MLSHTSLLVEFLIAGQLVLYAFLLLTVSLLPTSLQHELLTWLNNNMFAMDELLPLLALPAISLAYGLGMLAEIATRTLFDRLLVKLRLHRLGAFFRANAGLLASDPLFRLYAGADPDKVTIKDTALIGDLRFVVMHKSERLYKEIESQINQLRILRVLFVFLLLTALALVVLLARQITGALTGLITGGTVLIAVLLLLDFFAIRSRYDRYCRAVVLSYKALLLDKAA